MAKFRWTVLSNNDDLHIHMAPLDYEVNASNHRFVLAWSANGFQIERYGPFFGSSLFPTRQSALLYAAQLCRDWQQRRELIDNNI